MQKRQFTPREKGERYIREEKFRKERKREERKKRQFQDVMKRTREDRETNKCIRLSLRKRLHSARAPCVTTPSKEKKKLEEWKERLFFTSLTKRDRTTLNRQIKTGVRSRTGSVLLGEKEATEERKAKILLSLSLSFFLFFLSSLSVSLSRNDCSPTPLSSSCLSA